MFYCRKEVWWDLPGNAKRRTYGINGINNNKCLSIWTYVQKEMSHLRCKPNQFRSKNQMSLSCVRSLIFLRLFFYNVSNIAVIIVDLYFFISFGLVTRANITCTTFLRVRNLSWVLCFDNSGCSFQTYKN